MTGVNKKKRKSLSYKSFPSAIRPVAHSADILIPEFKKLPDLSIDEHSDKEQHDYKEFTDVDDDDEDFACSSMPVLFDQQNLSDFAFCKDIPGVLMKLVVTDYSFADWRLFIDSSKRCVKCVLLHITNVYG